MPKPTIDRLREGSLFGIEISLERRCRGVGRVAGRRRCRVRRRRLGRRCGLQDPCPAPPPPHPSGFVLVDGEGSVDGGIVGSAHLPADLGGAEGKQEGDRLGGGEGAVEARHPVRASAADERSPVAVTAGEDVAQLPAVDVTGEAEAFGSTADPAAGRLARAEVVLLRALGDGGEVVVGSPAASLAMLSTMPPPRRTG